MKFSCLTSGPTAIPSMFYPFALKMEEQGMPPIVINVFKCYYTQLVFGSQGKLTERDIEPLRDDDVRDYDSLDAYRETGRQAMSKTAIIKLNGGLGTTMGLEKAKSLIPAKDGLTFLDIILRQTACFREKYKAHLPLLLMNSFKTHMDTMLRIEGFTNGDSSIPLAFVQHKYPKILQKDYSPASWPDNPELEWNPPGHGDVYTALITSGILTKLLNKGYRYAFISNSDNLGAVISEAILGYMVGENLPFVMEVADRTVSDRKGGHLARMRKDGHMVLREVAQCPQNEIDSFQDIERYRFFNTNSLWIDLHALEKVFVDNRMMPLDIIINPKTLDPRDPSSPRVWQIETAMGSAISAFDHSKAVRVPRTRFAPVKATSDLLLVMSDCYLRTKTETIEPNPDRREPMPDIRLDPKFYKKIDWFSERFPAGAPSLLNCHALKIEGDVLFEPGVTLKGDVVIRNKTGRQMVIRQGDVVEGERAFE